jgi:hypothetical protein
MGGSVSWGSVVWVFIGQHCGLDWFGLVLGGHVDEYGLL